MFNNLLELRNTPNQRPGEEVVQVTVAQTQVMLREAYVELDPQARCRAGLKPKKLA